MHYEKRIEFLVHFQELCVYWVHGGETIMLEERMFPVRGALGRSPSVCLGGPWESQYICVQ